MKSQAFYSLKDLITALGVTWDDTMLDVIPEHGPLYYGSEDEVFTNDTHRRHPNHELPEVWLLRYNTPKYDKDHDRWLTLAHYMKDNRHLIGQLCTEDEKQRRLLHKRLHPEMVQATSARNNAKPEHKIKHKECNQVRDAAQWMIDHDITIEYHNPRCKKPTVRTFKANTKYKWSTLLNYYGNNTSVAIDDGWFKVTQ